MTLIIKRMYITALLFSLCAVFTMHFDYKRPCPPNIWPPYKQRKILKTCLTNHKGTISCHDLLIASGEDTQTHMLYWDFVPGWLVDLSPCSITIPSASGWFTTYICNCLFTILPVQPQAFISAHWSKKASYGNYSTCLTWLYLRAYPFHLRITLFLVDTNKRCMAHSK